MKTPVNVVMQGTYLLPNTYKGNTVESYEHSYKRVRMTKYTHKLNPELHIKQTPLPSTGDIFICIVSREDM